MTECAWFRSEGGVGNLMRKGLPGSDCRNSLAMVECPDWGVLPDAIVSKFLWSDHLRLLDKLRCQEVCKTWKRLLSECPSELERTDLSHELCINFNDRTNTMHQHIAIRLEQEPPTIQRRALILPRPQNPVLSAGGG